MDVGSCTDNGDNCPCDEVVETESVRDFVGVETVGLIIVVGVDGNDGAGDADADDLVVIVDDGSATSVTETDTSVRVG